MSDHPVLLQHTSSDRGLSPVDRRDFAGTGGDVSCGIFTKPALLEVVSILLFGMLDKQAPAAARQDERLPTLPKLCQSE